MKKRSLILGLIIMMFGLVTNAQTTVSIPDTTVAENTAVSLPVYASSLGDIGSITMHITYDENVLEFVGFENSAFEGDQNFLYNAKNGTLTIAWYSATKVSITDKLFNVVFNYLGGTSALAFSGTNEITDESAQPIDVTFEDGSIGPLPTKLILSDEVSTPGEQVSVSLSSVNLEGIGSMTLYLHFDPDVLEFAGLANDAVGFADPGAAANGDLTLAWYSTTPFSNYDGKLVDLVFNYIGGSSDVTFDAMTSEVTDSNGVALTNITYTNGSVSSPDLGFILPDVKGSKLHNVNVPLEGAMFDNVGSFTIRITYPKDELSYVGYDNLISGSFNANENEVDSTTSELVLAYYNTDGLTFGSDTIVDLVFDYTGTLNGDPTVLNFEDNYEVTDVNGVQLMPDFTNGSIFANAVPTFEAALPDTTLMEQDTLTYTYVATDLDLNDVLNYYIVEGPGSIDSTTGLYTWNTVDGDMGEHTIKVGVTDGTDTTTTSAVVTVLNNNNPPVFTSTIPSGTVITPESTPDGWVEYSFQYEATDPEDDALVFSLVTGPTGSAITEAGLFTWTPTDADADMQDIAIVVKVSDGDLYATDSTSVSTGNVLGVNDEAVPTVYSISQNYPNPFNPTTQIRFGLPSASNVNITVFNILGQQVKTLINGTMSSGFHTVNFDASKLISGMYFYRIQAEGIDGSKFTDVKKMLLVK